MSRPSRIADSGNLTSPAPEAHDGMSHLGRKAARGLGWVALMRYANRLTGFLTTLILARLVVPEDFGLVAVATMALEVVHIMKDMGLSQALIYRRGAIATASATAFYLLFGVNVLLFLALCLAAPLLSDFFQEPRVMPVLIVMSTNLIWFGARAVPDALIRKELDFHRLVLPTVVPVLLASVVSIIMAYRGFGVWSLAVRALIVEALSTILIWRYTEFRPRWVFDWKVAKELLSYGKHLIGASIVAVALYNVDRFFVSKLESIAMLGIYTLAYTLASVPVGELGHLVCRVMFPALAKLNGDQAQFRSGLSTTLEMSGLISIPLGVGIAVYGPELVHVLFGEEWWGASIPLQLLALAATCRSISVLLHEASKAAGRPQVVQWALAYRLAIISTFGLLATIRWSVTGLCATILLAYVSALVIEVMVLGRAVGMRPSRFLRLLFYPLVVATTSIPAGYVLVDMLLPAFSMNHLFVGSLATAAVYIALAFHYQHYLITRARIALAI